MSKNKDKQLKDKAIEFKGKDYVLVKDRVNYFNDEYPNGAIVTASIWEEDRVEVKATITPDVSVPARMFTGHSQAVVGTGYINKTSALENAETSAVGRALAFMGIGVIDSIASDDEMTKSGAKDNNKPFKTGPKTTKKDEDEEEDEEDDEDEEDEEEDDEDTEEDEDEDEENDKEPVKLSAKELSQIKPITQLLKNAVSESELKAAKKAAKIAKDSLNENQQEYLVALFEETAERINED